MITTFSTFFQWMITTFAKTNSWKKKTLMVFKAQKWVFEVRIRGNFGSSMVL
jgi:hypothetical protein